MKGWVWMEGHTANKEKAPRLVQVRWTHTSWNCVVSSCRPRWEWTDRLLTSVTPLHRLSLSLTLTSNILQLSPPALLISCYSSENASSSKKLPALMVSPHKTNRLRREQKKKSKEKKKEEQATGQSWAATCRLAGGDPWPLLLLRFHEQQSLSGDLTSWMLRDP